MNGMLLGRKYFEEQQFVYFESNQCVWPAVTCGVETWTLIK